MASLSWYKEVWQNKNTPVLWAKKQEFHKEELMKIIAVVVGIVGLAVIARAEMPVETNEITQSRIPNRVDSKSESTVWATEYVTKKLPELRESTHIWHVTEFFTVHAGLISVEQPLRKHDPEGRIQEKWAYGGKVELRFSEDWRFVAALSLPGASGTSRGSSRNFFMLVSHPFG